MLEIISNFASNIICVVMMSLLLKMIIPDGKNKKYISFICGTIITITLIEPILSLLTINIEEVFEENVAEYKEYKIEENLYEDNIKKSYEKKLVEDITSRLNENGYNVSNVKVEYDDVTFSPTRVYMNLENKSDSYVQPIKIEISKNINSSNDFEISKIKNIINNAYGIDNENIYIN